ncbi:unnamed protein product [Linum tenue]|uniref:Uncharacterized protein n=1 Tax=Linum tenue TaxID=586396 RepID=A0AAV0QLN2_9ROSI|nr:unnamed protein product [Linum tenue]
MPCRACSSLKEVRTKFHRPAATAYTTSPIAQRRSTTRPLPASAWLLLFRNSQPSKTRICRKFLGCATLLSPFPSLRTSNVTSKWNQLVASALNFFFLHDTTLICSTDHFNFPFFNLFDCSIKQFTIPY